LLVWRIPRAISLPCPNRSILLGYINHL